MKIVFTTKGVEWDSMMDPRLGRTEYLLVYGEETEELSHFDNRDIANTAHGAGPQTVKHILDFNADVLITGNGPGGNASTVLQKTDIKVFIGAGDMTIQEAYEAYKNNTLKAF